MNKTQLFERIIKSQSGVLYVKGRPGIGKTAIFREIARKNKWQFFDVRLSQMDETDLLGHPRAVQYGDIEVMNYAHPKWLVQSNEKPTLIMFDELNRAQIGVRNAALQILNERQIGDLEINKNVYMVAIGNLGEDDGCEVEEFDNALNNRLIHYKYDMNLNEWVEAYANEHVNKNILSFLESNPEYYYRSPDVNDKIGAYPTPRSWTFLSDLIGKNSNINEFFELVKMCAHSYIGTASTKFVRFLEDTMNININDIIERWDAVKEDVLKMSRDRKSELLNAMKSIKIIEYAKVESESSSEKLMNIASFLNIIDEDERVGFLNDYMVHISLSDVKKYPKFKEFLKQFANIFSKIKALSV